jgi:2-dehydropantoate 2-reductase
VFRTAAEAGQSGIKFNYVVIASKANSSIKATAADVTPVISPDRTCIVVAQNGVGSEEVFRERWPRNSIISCAVSPLHEYLLPRLETSDVISRSG